MWAVKNKNNEREGRMEGLIIKSISGEYDCLVNEQIIKTKPLGIFRHKNISPKVGDKVIIKDNIITDILPRSNDLIRPFVSNVNKALIVTSLVEPDLNLNLLDRIIANVEYNDIEAILIFSKADLVKDLSFYEDIFAYYKSINYKIFLLPNDALEIKKEIQNNICVLAGQSGVGKSTFVNILSNLNIKTDNISKALGRGKHTTRHTELLKIENGWLADTPGFGTLDLDMSLVDLSHSFVEFFNTKCKFNGCLHINEPSCMVKEKVKNNEILKSRYDNYMSFVKEIKEKPKKY